MSPVGPRWLGLAAGALVLALLTFGAVAVAGGCAWASQEAAEPGAPAAPERCEQRVSPAQAGLLALGLAAAGGAAFRRPWAAWPPALLMLAVVGLLVFSLGNLVPLAAGVVAVVAAWHLAARRLT